LCRFIVSDFRPYLSDAFGEDCADAEQSRENIDEDTGSQN
jgi:hypothetical protein